MKKVLSSSFLALTIMTALVGCNHLEKQPAEDKEPAQTEVQKQHKPSKEELMSADLKLKEIELVEDNPKPRKWVESPNKTRRATLVGLEPEDYVDGMVLNSFLALENTRTKETKVFDIDFDSLNGPQYALNGLLRSDLSVLKFKWIDEDNLYLLIGMGVKGIEDGGHIFKYNIPKNELTLLHEVLPREKEYGEEIVEFTPLSNNELKVKVAIYEGKDWDKKRYEERIIKIKQ